MSRKPDEQEQLAINIIRHAGGRHAPIPVSHVAQVTGWSYVAALHTLESAASKGLAVKFDQPWPLFQLTRKGWKQAAPVRGDTRRAARSG